MEIQRRTDFVCTACFPWLHFLYITGSVEVEPKILIQIPQLWLLEWGCNRLKKFLFNGVGQTKWESDLWQLEGPPKKQKKKQPVCRLAKWSMYFIRKKKQNFVFFVSFCFHFFSLYFQPWLAGLVVFPTIPQLLIMFCFMMLGSQVDLYFWNRMPVYFARARGAYKSIVSILFTRVKFTCVRT